MNKLVKLGAVAFLSITLFSCSENTADTSTPETEKEDVAQEESTHKVSHPTKNFAVVWNWKTDEQFLVDSVKVEQTSQLIALWEEGVVRDVYYDKEGRFDKMNNNPNISFFIKAVDIDEAKSVLDEMVMVKANISEYTIYEVGSKWLGESKESNKYNNNFVAVWNTVTKFDNPESADLIRDNAKSQSDAVVELWENGYVENIYFDIKGINDLDDVTDFVMFVRADTEEDARELLDKLPFKEKQIASYILVPVGTFWLGENDAN